jgi:hypothetical protein
MAVVRAIFSQGGWLQSRRVGDGNQTSFGFISFSLVDFYSHFD